MRIDPSQLSAPLAHVLGVGSADAAAGQKASAAAGAVPADTDLDSLDAALLRRLRANAMADAAHSVVSFQDAQTRVAQLREQLFANPADGRSALSDLDPSRVRGLLGR